MANVQAVGVAFFLLDEELELLPGHLTPHAHESLVRFGARLPSFEQAVEELALTLQVSLSEATGRRWTEAAGAACEAVQQQEVEPIEREMPEAVKGASKLLVSADGVMVPLVGGEWAEVKTVTIGEIKEIVRADGRCAWATTSRFSTPAPCCLFLPCRSPIAPCGRGQKFLPLSSLG